MVVERILSDNRVDAIVVENGRTNDFEALASITVFDRYSVYRLSIRVPFAHQVFSMRIGSAGTSPGGMRAAPYSMPFPAP